MVTTRSPKPTQRPAPPAGLTWHTGTVDAALASLAASAEGLSSAQAAERLQAFGPNRLPEPPRPSALRRLLRHFHNILIYVLLGSAVVTALLGHAVDTAVILAVVVANALIGYFQEGKAERAMASLRGLLAPRAAVLRDGRRMGVDAATLVPGDIVLVEAGDRVPADLRLLQARGLQVQEAILTGESLPVDKQLAPVAADAALGDRRCLAFSGTLVTAGQGRGVVIGTGADTEIGRISGLLSGVEQLVTPLVRQMDRFARGLTLVILAASGLLLGVGLYFGGRSFEEAFMAVVSLAVAAIPEGLPAVLTITLAVGVQAMARRNAIVRRLPAIETLGAVSVICTDKTGTLTRNEMVVASVATAEATFTASGEGYAPQGELQADGGGHERTALQALARACALCNDAALHAHDGEWRVEGDPMEGALLALAGKAGVDLGRIGADWPRRDAIPFDARHRFMASLNGSPDGQAFAMVKGAPERILAMCRAQLHESGEQALDAAAWHRAADAIAARGQRVLALATRAMPPDCQSLAFEDVEGPLVLLGLVGLIDPPRPEAVAAVAECQRAGIRVKMITGDHAGTAAAIGAQVGLENPSAVLTGADLDAMDEAALAAAVERTDVFARTSPEHKLRLVMALQAHGRVVAMTGDGVNDAPALKAAHVGVAMGGRGTDVAREAASIVLLDDNFASIVGAVRLGRRIFDNLRKSMSYILAVHVPIAGMALLPVLLGWPTVLFPLHIAFLELVIDPACSMVFENEPAESDVMQRPPRDVQQPLFGGMALGLALLQGLGALAVVLAATVWGATQLNEGGVRALAFAVLVFTNLALIFSNRSRSGPLWASLWVPNRTLWLVVTAALSLLALVLYVPWLATLFLFEPLPMSWLAGAAVLGLASVLWFEFLKVLKSKMAP